MFVTRPEALENAIQHDLGRIQDCLRQIRSRHYPLFDENCRREIGECLVSIAKMRDVQRQADPLYIIHKLCVEDLLLDDLPADMTLLELRQIQKYVRL